MNMSYDNNVNITTADLFDNNRRFTARMKVTYDNNANTLQAVVSGKHGNNNIVSDPIIGTAGVNREIQTFCRLYNRTLNELASGVRDEDKIIQIDKEVLDTYDLLRSNKLLKKKNVAQAVGAQQVTPPQGQQTVPPQGQQVTPQQGQQTVPPQGQQITQQQGQQTVQPQGQQTVPPQGQQVTQQQGQQQRQGFFTRVRNAGSAAATAFRGNPQPQGQQVTQQQGQQVTQPQGQQVTQPQGQQVTQPQGQQVTQPQGQQVTQPQGQQVTQQQGQQVTQQQGNQRQNQPGRRKKIVRNVLIFAGVAALIGTVAYVICKNSKDVRKSNDNNYKPKNEYNNEIDNTQYNPTPAPNTGVVVDKNGNETIVGYYDNNGNHYVNDYELPSVEDPSYNVDQYNYASLGSVVSSDEMSLQLQLIDDSCFTNSSAHFQNLVVNQDYNTMAVISSMRNSVVEGFVSGNEFVDNAVRYIFRNSTKFDDNNVKSFDSLSPYARYIVVRMTQGILQLYSNNYSSNIDGYNYTMQGLANDFESIESPLYNQLVGGRTY